MLQSLAGLSLGSKLASQTIEIRSGNGYLWCLKIMRLRWWSIRTVGTSVIPRVRAVAALSVVFTMALTIVFAKIFAMTLVIALAMTLS